MRGTVSAMTWREGFAAFVRELKKELQDEDSASQ
jgi:hypothetical protein